MGPLNAATVTLLVLATVVRLWNIASVPVALHPDELAGWLGVHDMLAGKTHPGVFFNYRVLYLPLYGIFESASSCIFGNDPTALRLPAALLGTATCLAAGLLTYTFLPNRRALPVACGVMAILPWDIAISRLATERAATLPFLLFGLYFLRRGLQRSNERDVWIAFALLAVGAYSYRAAAFDTLILPLMLLAIEYRATAAVGRAVQAAAFMWALLILPLAFSFSSFFGGPVPFTFGDGLGPRSFSLFLHYYLAHFSPSALFLTGDGNLVNGPHFGVLYAWMAPFIVIGLVAPGREVTLRTRLFLWAWLLLYPLGGSLATDGNGHAHFMRTLIGAPLFCALTAMGLVATCGRAAQRLRGKPSKIALGAIFYSVVAAQFGLFLNEYFRHYPTQSAELFRYGDDQLFAYIRAHESRYRRVCIDALTWWNYTTEVGYYMWGDPFPTIEGLRAPCIQRGSLLVLTSPLDAPPGTRLVATVQRIGGAVRVYLAAL